VELASACPIEQWTRWSSHSRAAARFSGQVPFAIAAQQQSLAIREAVIASAKGRMTMASSNHPAVTRMS